MKSQALPHSRVRQRAPGRFPARARARVRAGLCVVLACCLLACVPARAESPAVTIVTGPGAPTLEQLAAKELEQTLVSLFDAEVTPTEASTEGPHLILLGSPATNPAVASAMGREWPADLGEQGHLLKSTPEGLVLGGGSPLATLWAVAEYGHLNGIRVLPGAEYLPVERPTFTLDGFDTTLKPLHETRAWRTLGSTPASQAAWGLEDLEPLIRRLALMKFNQLVLRLEPTQVFSGAVSGGSGIWDGEVIELGGDFAGRSAFKGAKVFDHPALIGATTSAERSASAEIFVNELIGTAHRFGLEAMIEVGGDDVLDGTEEADRARIEARFPDADGVAWETLGPDMKFATHPGGYLPHQFAASNAALPPAHFLIDADLVADYGHAIWALARASFKPTPDAGAALHDLVAPICGEGVAESFSNGLAALADAAEQLAKDESGPGVADFMSFYHSSEAVPEAWAEAKACYGQAIGEFYRANTRARDGARPFILRYAKRATFALHYLSAAEAARRAGIAKAEGDEEAHLENLELAVEALHNALAIYAEVATEPGDAGAIALLNRDAYQPLLEELDTAPLE